MGETFLRIPVSTAICLPRKSFRLATKIHGTHKHPHPKHDRVNSTNTLGFSHFSTIEANGEPDGISEPILPILRNSNPIKLSQNKGRLLSKQPKSHLIKGGCKSPDKFI